MNKWIKKDDTVVVIAGNERGKTGKVLSRKAERVVVQGLNIRKKHVKRKSKVPTPEIMEFEMSMHISNVRICGEDGKPLKLKARVSSKGKKELIYLDGSKEVVYREISGAEQK
ncbi:MAG: 50S ribosomal protein L24 [Chlamydiales bacterium]|nr:50S ribosomal protein L24 [Chlamydiales bacterium]